MTATVRKYQVKLHRKLVELQRELTKEKERARIAKADAKLQAKCLERIGNALGNPEVLLEGLEAWTSWVIKCIKNTPGTNKKLLAELRKKERSLQRCYIILERDTQHFQKGCVSKEEIEKLTTVWKKRVVDHEGQQPPARCLSCRATTRCVEELLGLLGK